MPELPEVQTTVNGIKKLALGLTIKDAWTDYGSAFHVGKDNIADPAFFARFRKAVRGAIIADTSRRGKNVLIHLSNGKTILIHMKMTGHVMYGRYVQKSKAWVATDPGPLRDDPFNRFVHFILNFTNGYSLALCDMRKFAKVTLVETASMSQSVHLSEHGPEPLDPDFTVADFKSALLARPEGPIKTVLMDHQTVSGIGNIYSDEILWRAGVHPLSIVRAIPAAKLPLMFSAMRETLASGIDFGGDSMSDYRNIHGERGAFQGRHNAYRRTGEPCGRRGCHGTIRRLVVGGRSGHYCDGHQKLYT
ncbi:MAG TPA: bifunctional DNA-formamidopyrimidine glycosylase/DNA-(apurinic or apyrimidinic site) lyase [Candidatus Paceibacterota bacterium]|nr:bifunctional DNA-formamidopyrimidine glycosylase/DNA-(apurinic or apyrimidinic site) lyase [Candidatus Paceibacterota bacterium]